MINQLEISERIIKAAVKRYNPTHIVSMVSGGTDSATSHALLKELGVKIDFVIHGNTRTGIRETTDFVIDHYGKTDDVVIADAGDAYENYLMRKGFFGIGQTAHQYAYRILKAQPFRTAISKNIRHGKRGVRVLMFNGARKYESENRAKNLRLIRRDPASKNNIWVNPIHFWSAEDKNTYLYARGIKINPVAKALCRSGECLCGTMQSQQTRIEAASIYPEWGAWLDDLEKYVIKKHGFGWGVSMPKHMRAQKQGQPDMFMPMCVSCNDVEQIKEKQNDK